MLTFATAPDHEDPADDGTNNVYQVTVTATGGTGARAMTATQDISVTVNDVDETPAITSVSVVSDPGADDTYGLGDTIEVQVVFDQAVIVTGAPSIEFEAGGNQAEHLKLATYADGSGTATLRFDYVVQSGDMDDNGIWLKGDKLELNGGTILGVDDDVAANLDYSSLGRQDDHKVDGSLTPPATNVAPITGDFDLHADNGDPTGIWGNDETIWISEDAGLPSTSDKLFAYKRSDGARDTGKDFDGLNDAGNNDPAGIWSDGVTMFVVDGGDRKVYAYKMVDDPDTLNVDEFGTRDTSLEFNLHSSNNNPLGIWGNDDTIWISQNAAPAIQDKLFAYKRSDGARDTGKDFDGLNDAGNNYPTGIWSDGTSMFVADLIDDKVYAYALSGGSRHSSRDITLGAENGSPGGLWGDPAAGVLGTLWVVDQGDDKLYAYSLYHSATGAPTIDGTPVVGETLTADASGIEDLDGIPDDVEFSYQWIRVDGGSDADIAGANESAYTLVAADVGKQIKVRVGFTDSPGNDESVSSEATEAVTVAVPITGDFDLDADNGDPTGIWGNDETIWISEDAGLPSTSDKLFAYKRSNGHRDSGKDFDGLSAAGNNDPAGIWSDGVTMFVVDGGDKKVYAYKMMDDPDTLNVDEFGTRDTSLEFNLHSSNNNPLGIWGNDNTIWISQNATPAIQDKLFAYKRSDGARDSGKDFDGLNDAGNNYPTGIWSDGTSMFVADLIDDKVYAYALSGGSRHSGRDITLDADNGSPGGLWGDPAADVLGTLWVVDQGDDKLYAYDLVGVNRAPAFLLESTTREVEENSPAGTAVGDPVTATDADDDTLTYTLEGTDAASFQIDSTSGQIQTKSGVTYDYETKSSYSVTVKADDGKGGTDTIAVAIDLLDVDETMAPPAVTDVDVTSTPSATADTYGWNETIEVTVTFDQAVRVTGTPRIQLRIGGGQPQHRKWATTPAVRGPRRCGSPMSSRRGTWTTTASTSKRTSWCSTAGRSWALTGPTPFSITPGWALNPATRWTAA